MLRTGILHPELGAWLARLGHHDRLLISDAGYPMVPGAARIDLGFAPGRPGLLEVVEAVVAVLPLERVWVAAELPEQQPGFFRHLEALLPAGVPVERLADHETFKATAAGVPLMVRTGEFTPFANCLLECGVGF
ncbi:D-ribose pyranase [Candidatus Hydrogenisulfobacillus filiaventi]|uniref:D-ribose pyranase n=1 Tax=Candidatus Hydrogenisulfobacillus filiaventi TaxID=2707344 RepID=A0A6F8ZFD3_9FIRM|nr:D-ribose pyranase [Candidatus Hydrogenisulfobacillus filiaventi]